MIIIIIVISMNIICKVHKDRKNLRRVCNIIQNAVRHVGISCIGTHGVTRSRKHLSVNMLRVMMQNSLRYCHCIV